MNENAEELVAMRSPSASKAKIDSPQSRASSSPKVTINRALIGTMLLIHFSLTAWVAFESISWLNGNWFAALPVERLVAAGALHLPLVFERFELWRLLTAAFLHGSILHLAFNLWALASIGNLGERLWGSRFHALMFVVAALGASLAAMASVEGLTVVGASGAIFGYATALILELRQLGHRSPVPPRAQRSLTVQIVAWLILGLVAPLFVDLPIAGFGHLGGALFGAGLWWALRARRRRWLGWVALGSMTFAMTAAWNARLRPEHYRELQGFAALDSDPKRAAELLRPAALRPDADPELANAWAYSEVLSKGDLDLAIEIGRRALSAEPENPDFQDTVGWALCLNRQPTQGLALLESALQLAPEVDEIAEHRNFCRLLVEAVESDSNP